MGPQQPLLHPPKQEELTVGLMTGPVNPDKIHHAQFLTDSV